MNKKQIIESISQISGLTKKASGEALDAFMATVSETIKTEKVTLSGFGTFSCVDKAERQGRNVRTGELITIPAKKAPKFKAGKELKEMVAKA